MSERLWEAGDECSHLDCILILRQYVLLGKRHDKATYTLNFDEWRCKVLSVSLKQTNIV